MLDFSMPVFSDRLSTLRKRKKIYQKEIATLLEVTERHYRDYEGGRVNPPASKLYALATYFDVSVDYLLGRTDNPKVNK